MNFESFVIENPIIKISPYLHIQVQTLKQIGEDIEAELDSCIMDSSVDAKKLMTLYGLFWLWILGAFEVSRTLSSSQEFLKLEKRNSVKLLKNHLIKIRSPMAKHQLSGRRDAVYNELSISNMDLFNKDFCLDIGNEKFWVRKTIARFRDLIDSISSDDMVENCVVS